MRPYVICHMLASIDGKIDGSFLRAVTGTGDYETTGAMLKGDAWVCGRITMQQHFADKEPFISTSNRPAGPQPLHVARRAQSYAISVDTVGKLRWSKSNIYGDHLICVLSERVPEDYLILLRKKKISYVVTGKVSVDLVQAAKLLPKHFEIKTLLLEGGGHINGAFLEAGLVDEVSLLLVPAIDGRREIPAVFDSVNPSLKKAVQLRLKSVEQRKNGALWIRYQATKRQE